MIITTPTLIIISDCILAAAVKNRKRKHAINNKLLKSAGQSINFVLYEIILKQENSVE